MLNARAFLSRLAGLGVGVVSGVPCSYLTALHRHLERGEWPYVSASAEGEAVAIAAGAWLGNSQGMVICQNSGLGNMVNPLSSLTAPFEIPVLLGVSRRGWPVGTDEPQHAVMGRITPSLLELLGLPTEVLHDTPDGADRQLTAAAEAAAARRSTAFVIHRGTFADPEGPGERAGAGRDAGDTGPAGVRTLTGGRPATRSDVLERYLALAGARPTIATTGYTSRELYALDDRDSHFYMVGSMGWAAGIGVGLSTTGRPVTVVDGDGALLMHLGTLATAARYVGDRFLHVVLDNGMHESTGGQRTNIGGADLASVARGLGYRAVWRCAGVDAVSAALAEALATTGGPVLVHCRIAAGHPSGLPRVPRDLPGLALRFRAVAGRTATPTRRAPAEPAMTEED
ncbi:MAG TPA: phosphonopyruvate decarboxylase [Mycobacteriales bacterium]|nr:phosphonopyruvate decarboxylase [Mycobacteriales bacterium]